MDEAKQELAALHALGMLSGAEEAQFIAELRRDPELQNLVDELSESAAGLVHALPTTKAPPDVFARVMASVAGEKTAIAIAPRRSGYAWPIAACALVLTGIFYWQAASLKSAMEQMRDRYQSLQVEKDASLRTQVELAAEVEATKAKLREETAKVAAERDSALARRSELEKIVTELRHGDALAQLKIATLQSKLDAFSKVVAVMVWDPDSQTGVVKFDGLPAQPSDKDYQLWVIDPRYPAPVSGGVVKMGSGGAAHALFKAAKPISAVDKFAVSIERKGGVPNAQGPIVLISN